MKYIIVSVFLVSAVLWSCTKDVGSLPVTVFDDAALYNLVKVDSGKTTWKNAANDSLFTSGAEHGSKQYKLRMNAWAKAACTDAGKLPTGGVFPDSSLLVKQLYTTPGGAVEKYAVLYKKSGAWLWAEYGVSGNVVKSFNSSSATCTGCHTSNRDQTWTFDSH